MDNPGKMIPMLIHDFIWVLHVNQFLTDYSIQAPQFESLKELIASELPLEGAPGKDTIH